LAVGRGLLAAGAVPMHITGTMVNPALTATLAYAGGDASSRHSSLPWIHLWLIV